MASSQPFDVKAAQIRNINQEYVKQADAMQDSDQQGIDQNINHVTTIATSKSLNATFAKVIDSSGQVTYVCTDIVEEDTLSLATTIETKLSVIEEEHQLEKTRAQIKQQQEKRQKIHEVQTILIPTLLYFIVAVCIFVIMVVLLASIKILL